MTFNVGPRVATVFAACSSSSGGDSSDAQGGPSGGYVCVFTEDRMYSCGDGTSGSNPATDTWEDAGRDVERFADYTFRLKLGRATES